MSKKWFHSALPMFIQAEESWVKERVSSSYTFKIPEELLNGVADLIKNHMISEGNLVIFTETKLLPSKTPPQQLVTLIEKKEYNLQED